MNFNESKQCFKEEFLSLWDAWNPSEREQSHWIITLQKYTPDEIKKTLFQYHQKYELYKKPKMPKFIELISVITHARAWKEQPEHNPMFWLVRERDGVMKPVYGKIGKIYSDEQIRNTSQIVAEKCSSLYGENWFVLTSQESDLRRQYPFGRYPGRKVVDSGQPQAEQEKTVDVLDTPMGDDEKQPITELIDFEKNPEFEEDYVPPDDGVPF